MGRGQGEHRGCGLIEAANQEFPAVPPKPIYVPRGRWSVGCLVVASKLRPTVSVPHCSGPVDSTMSVTNSVDATRPRASNVVYTLPPPPSSRNTLRKYRVSAPISSDAIYIFLDVDDLIDRKSFIPTR